MDFVGYAEGAARLVNAPMSDPDDLAGFLSDRDWLSARVIDRDPRTLRRFTAELREVFQASSGGDEQSVVARLNALLSTHRVTPHIAGHDSQSWHLHVANASSVPELLIAEALLGLATVVCESGLHRLGVCQATACDDVFVDTSPNRSRRYCSDRCSSRANVAAYRARQRSEQRAEPVPG
ncbi:MAG: CGNR zinc finger domain-containing protein [Actinomycetota bacterium]|nr:CGNR zinc finger domain-containing protein [Actinomycetota bacterium]